MSIVSIAQASQYAQNAGFSGAGLINILAIALAESGLNTEAKNCSGNTPSGSCDRGILQINSYWHKGVSDQCAYDPQCAFQNAFVISNGGQSFSPWTTYSSGRYKSYINQVAKVVPPGVSASNPTDVGTGNPINSLLASDQIQKVGLLFIAIIIIIIGATILLRTDKSPAPAQEGES